MKRFGNRKKSNPKKGLFLVILLAIALFLFFNAEKLISRLF
jgi:hypothetical protein